jgi:hypothetical protein
MDGDGLDDAVAKAFPAVVAGRTERDDPPFGVQRLERPQFGGLSLRSADRRSRPRTGETSAGRNMDQAQVITVQTRSEF